MVSSDIDRRVLDPSGVPQANLLLCGGVSAAAGPEIERVFRREYGRVVSVLIHLVGDFQLAEDLVAQAFERALDDWPRHGIPDNPGAWLTTVARRRGLDRLRHAQMARRKHELIVAETGLDDLSPREDQVGYPDERLRLIFTCCHPSLAPEVSVALTLRTLGGLETGEIARAFLLTEATLAQRLVRAKKKIRLAGIPYEVPGPSHLGERISAVLGVIYLIFNEGYQASVGALIRVDLCEEAIRLGALLCELMPEEAEARGLLAMMLLHHSRRTARSDAQGELVLMEDQNRELWDRASIERGLAHLDHAMSLKCRGPYQMQAAIAALHAGAARAEETDWAQILMLYQGLLQMHDSPVVRLNAVVALAMVEGPDRGLDGLHRLEADGRLDDYHPFWSAKADLLRRCERFAEAAIAYARALDTVSNETQRRFLEKRRTDVLDRTR
jgi:RNA polymerase sigma-70 factor (ECF subfamily)